MKRRLAFVLKATAAILICIMGFATANAIYQLPISAQSAYQACRQIMLTTEGYGVWELRSSRFLFISARYTFSDGFNDTICSATGFGTSWQAKPVSQTLVGCMLSLEAETECPRRIFGVSP